MDKPTTKRCPRCKTVKPRSEFYRNRRQKDGLQCWCKPCLIERKLDWCSKNAETMREISRRHYRRHAEEIRAQKLRYSRENPDKVAARMAIKYALRRGDIVRQSCEECGEPNAHAHHDDYSQHMDVRWLCPTHHNRLHAEERSR
jgi:hypothetical protein